MREPKLLTNQDRGSYNSGNTVNAPAARQRSGAGHRRVSPVSASQRTPKRVRVEGVPNLYQRPADGKYECGYQGSDRKWHMKTLRAATLTEAKREQRDLLGKRDRVEDVAPSNLTFAEVAEEFFTTFGSHVARGQNSARTLDLYRQRYKTHLRADLGPRRLQSLQTKHLSDFLAELRAKRKKRKGKPTDELLSDWTIRGVYTLLGSILDHAVSRGYVSDNALRRLPKQERPRARNKTKARILDAEQLAKLIEHALPGYRVLIVVAVFTALRQSELLGLRWQDIDFESGQIRVRHQLSRATRKEPARLLPLKTDAGERDIDLAPELGRVLRSHKLASGYSKDDDFVFATETGRPIYYRNATERGLTKAADRAGLNPEDLQRLSFHDLRHTAITHLIRSGADVALVQRFAGHSKPSITLDLYVGEFEKRKVNDSGQRLAAAYAGVLDTRI